MYISQCLTCARRTSLKNGVYGCEAFETVPNTIVENEFDHRNPYPGDNGLLFKKLEIEPKPGFQDEF